MGKGWDNPGKGKREEKKWVAFNFDFLIGLLIESPNNTFCWLNERLNFFSSKQERTFASPTQTAHGVTTVVQIPKSRVSEVGAESHPVGSATDTGEASGGKPREKGRAF